MGFPGGSDGKDLPAVQETQVQFFGQEDPLKKRMATHSNILAWRIPWTEEPPWVCEELDTTEVTSVKHKYVVV